jgi:hypothetical protein
MYQPTITTFTNAKPCPRAEVLFTAFAPGTTSVTVWREAAGRKFRVRGAVRAAVAGSLTRLDTEIPFGVPVTYWAEMFDAAGSSLGLTDSAETILWCSDMWIHNPLQPDGAVRADFRPNATRELTRPVEGEIYYPQGRRVGVAVTGQRRGLQGVTLDLVVETVEDADKFVGLFGGYDDDFYTPPVLCIRKGDAHLVRIPNPFFAAVMSPSEVDFNYVLGGNLIDYQMKGDEVSPPAEGIAVPILTRADLNAWYQSNSDLNSDPANATRLSVNRRYDLAGTSS